MSKVYILVLNWNRKEETLECLESLTKLKVPQNVEINILVIDNASTDGSQEAFNKHNINFLQNKKNLGFAEGNNEGMKFALKNEADYVMLLNNDTYVDENLLVEILKPFKDKSVGVVSPLIYFAKGFEFHKNKYKKTDLGKVVWAAGGDIDWNNVYGQNKNVDKVDRGQFKKNIEVNFATGACVVYSKEALKKAGLFDPKYFMYYEDVDLSVRIKKKGFKIIFTPKAKLWHKVAQSSGIGSGLNDYFISRNRLYFGLKYASFRTRFALLREAFRLLLKGRSWQRVGVYDYFIGNFWKGSWQ